LERVVAGKIPEGREILDILPTKPDNQKRMNPGTRMGFVGRVLCVSWALIMLGGCAGDRGNIDPWEKTNRVFYNFDDGLDRVLLKPVSGFYVKVVPEPIRTGLGHGFANLGYGNVILNDLLQARWGQGLSDAGRMAVNSTIGIAGIFDVASRWGLPSRENDFGITLGKWGAEPGPYLVLPLLGPTTVRDAPGILVANLTNPVTWVSPPLYVTAPLGTVQAMDTRSRFESALRFRNAAAIDPYVFTRNGYLQYRDHLIHEGKKAPDQSLYDEEPESAPSSAPAATRAASQRAR
jgi:phospholipid-binding lipoprotein MlaA